MTTTTASVDPRRLQWLVLLFCAASVVSALGVAPAPLDALVIAPHPDDEVIGCAGVIQRTLAAKKRVTVVILTNGDEVVGTLDGRSVTGSNALIGLDKHSVMIGAGTQGSFRNFRVWEALPNADWPKTKQALQANAKPAR